MFRISVWVCAFLLLACFVLPMAAQQPAAASTNLAVPPIVNFSGALTDVNGKPLTGAVGVTFYLYQESQGGAPLWMETQNVQADKAGHYTAALGSISSHGLPASVFASGEARWLGVQIQGQAEQPRVLLMSVPYALKALDAETIGGKPASSFMLAPAASGNSGNSGKAANLPPGTITGTGTADFIPRFTGATTIGNSNIFETVGGNVGIATTTPAAKLDVKGTGDVRDTLTLFPKLAHPTLSIHGTAFAVSSTGNVTFIAGQTFPGTGTVTSVGSGAGLTGGPITHSGSLSIATGGVTNAMLAHSSLTVAAGTDLTGGGLVSLGGTTTLNLDTSKVPSLAGANSFTNNNAITANDSSASLTVANTSNGDAIDIVENGNAAGLFVNGGVIAVEVENAFLPIFAESPNTGIEAVFAEATNDSNQIAAIVGVQSGTTTGTIGVEGITSSSFFNRGIGVYGVGVTGNTTLGVSEGAGVLGDSAAGFGVMGLSDQQHAITGVNADSNNVGSPAAFFDNINSSTTDLVLYAEGFHAGGICTITTGGHLACNGALEHVAPVQGGSRKVALNSIGTPENWFEDAGSAHLSNGEAVVNLEGIFAETVNTGIEYHVFLTPNGDCKGLYIAQKSPSSFVVRELGGGTSNIPFDYRIMAKRIGYEKVRLADRTEQFRKPASMFGTNTVRQPWYYHPPQRPPAHRKSSIRPVSQTAKR